MPTFGDPAAAPVAQHPLDHGRGHTPDESGSGPDSDTHDSSRAAKRKRPLTVSYVRTLLDSSLEASRFDISVGRGCKLTGQM